MHLGAWLLTGRIKGRVNCATAEYDVSARYALSSEVHSPYLGVAALHIDTVEVGKEFVSTSASTECACRTDAS